MQFVNLTPHAINIRTSAGEIVIQPDGRKATVKMTADPRTAVVVGELTIPVSATKYGDVEGLPEPQDGVAYLVSALVLARVRNRTDVYAPDTGPSAIRFAEGAKKGQVEAVVALVSPEA